MSLVEAATNRRRGYHFAIATQFAAFPLFGLGEAIVTCVRLITSRNA